MLTLLFAATMAMTGLDDGLPARAPRAVGMSAERLEAIDRVVERGMSAGGYPGAAVIVGRKGAVVWQKGYGRLGWSEGYEEVNPERTIYDLASLTKVVGTTSALMVLYDRGQLDLDAPVSRYLPDFAGGTKDLVTVRHLLTHRSGLPAGRDLWRIGYTPEERRRAILETPLGCRPGACFEYSDLGADVLGMIVEEIAGERLDVFLDKNVFKPLGMNDTYFRPADSLRVRVAPTEVAPPRGYPLRGEVHDENAYALGGVAGHAGLFSTAADLSIYAQMMLNGGVWNGVRIVGDSTVQLFTRRAAGSRALGWDTADGDGGAGRYLSERAFGHLGYTGTSMWIDPDREMFVIMLSNRVHAARAKRPAKVISDVRNDLADAAALAVIDTPDGPLAMPVSFRADRAEGWNPVTKVKRGKARSRSARARAAERARLARKAKSARGSKASASKSSGKASSAKKKTTLSKASATKKTSSSSSKAKSTSSAKKKSTPAKKPAARKKRS